MEDDPTIERIRRVRRKIAEEYDFDTKKLIEHYRMYSRGRIMSCTRTIYDG